MKLRSGKTICDKGVKVCGHTCELWHDKCCKCSDTRPMKDEYHAFNQSLLSRVAIVKRDYYYCPTCKKTDYKKKNIVDAPKVDPQLDAKKLKEKSDEQKEIIESLNKTIAIYEKKIAELEKENTTLRKNVAARQEKLETISDLHNKIMDCHDRTIQTYDKIITSLEEQNATLMKNMAELEKKRDDANMEKRTQNLYDSGMGELVYHLGYCSDVIGDCWLPHYKTGGLNALKAALRNNSMWIHKNDKCEECRNTIDSIHD